ncbi:hypothetical protein [Catellatospora sichuanensis]|uniref:hypothetical protein n=1 Tax=Catellatospora sichuanensis TaxID=1969805 RepID=UPI001183A8F2|nr:hypothetical protein [Catellatospora sichuanensis]
MNDYRNTMEEYVGTAPRTAIDVDELVVRGRRAQRGRRLAAATGGLALSAVAALSAVSLLGATAGGPQPPAVASAAASTTAETPDQTAQRLLEVLKAAISREAPGVTGLETLQRQMHQCRPDAIPPARLVPYDAATFDTACPADSPLHQLREQNFDWLGQITVGEVTASVRIHVGRVPVIDPPGEQPDQRPELVGKAPGGGTGAPPASPGITVLANELVVEVVKPDGTDFFVGHPEKHPLLLADLWQAVGRDRARPLGAEKGAHRVTVGALLSGAREGARAHPRVRGRSGPGWAGSRCRAGPAR